MNRRPKILLLITNLGSGGAQKVFHQHRQTLARDHEVVSCVFNFDGAFDGEQNSGIISLGVPAGIGIFSKVFNFYKRARKLKALKKSLGIDITISHLEGADYVNVLSRGTDKVILWIHGSKRYDQNIRGWLGSFRLKVLLPFLYRRADRIVCVSEGIRSEIIRMVSGVEGKMGVVNNGVDISKIHRLIGPLRDEWPALFRENFVIVTHCRLARQKNIDMLLKVINTLKEVRYIKWVIAGDGEDRARLLALCREMSIAYHQCWERQAWAAENTVYFIGHQENPFPFLAAAHLYILPSLWEGFPLSICEAIACELPVMAADCSTGPREILGPELTESVSVPTRASFGLLMPLLVNDATGHAVCVWSDEILKLINNHQLLDVYRQKSEQTIRRFSIEQLETQMISQVTAVMK